MFTLCIHRPTMYYKTPDRNVKKFYIFKYVMFLNVERLNVINATLFTYSVYLNA